MTEIALPAVCDRAALIGLVDRIAAAIGEGPVTINASAVTKPGQVLLQLLLSARRSAAEAGRECRVVASDALNEIVELTGLGERLYEEIAA